MIEMLFNSGWGTVLIAALVALILAIALWIDSQE